MPRCRNGTRKHRKTRNCEKYTASLKRYCPRGTRKNRKTKICEKYVKKMKMKMPTSDNQVRYIVAPPRLRVASIKKKLLNPEMTDRLLSPAISPSRSHVAALRQKFMAPVKPSDFSKNPPIKYHTNYNIKLN